MNDEISGLVQALGQGFDDSTAYIVAKSAVQGLRDLANFPKIPHRPKELAGYTPVAIGRLYERWRGDARLDEHETRVLAAWRDWRLAVTSAEEEINGRLVTVARAIRQYDALLRKNPDDRTLASERDALAKWLRAVAQVEYTDDQAEMNRRCRKGARDFSVMPIAWRDPEGEARRDAR